MRIFRLAWVEIGGGRWEWPALAEGLFLMEGLEDYFRIARHSGAMPMREDDPAANQATSMQVRSVSPLFLKVFEHPSITFAIH
jgi:hypothetical protein